MDAGEIMRADAAVWKKRALAAEAKLSNYRKLRGYVEQVARARLEAASAKRSREVPEITVEAALEELFIESDLIGSLDAPRSFYAQKVDLGDGAALTIRLREGLGKCSELDFPSAVVEIEKKQPDEGRAIGLLFQLLQLSDMAQAVERGVSVALSADHLHDISPMLLILLQGTGLLNPAAGCTIEGIQRFVDEEQQKLA